MDNFIAVNRVLLKQERESEIGETKHLLENLSSKRLERKGLCLLKLYISRKYVGLFNRNILILSSTYHLPAHNFTAGDIVGLCLSGSTNEDVIASGIISKVYPSSISIAFDGDEEVFSLDDSQLYKIVKLANDITYKRLQKTLDKMESKSSHLADVLFGNCSLNPTPNEIKEINYFDKNLDDSQREAVRFSLEQKEVSIIHGPPGTGKTTTVTEVIRQAVHMNMKVLVCAPSNVAVDNLVEKLSSSKMKMVRLGHPARMLPSIMKHSLDAIVSSSDGAKIVEDVRRDINRLVDKFHSRHVKRHKQEMRDEMKALRAELKVREEQTISYILNQCQVVLCTLTMATEDGPLTPRRIKDNFDLVVIDECSQALEVACWTALLRGKKCILAGDHNQLPPTIISSGEVKEKLEVTLMERLIKQFGDSMVKMLTTQYRMHRQIMDWPSTKLYDGRLVASDLVAGHLLKDLPGVENCELTSTPLLFIDTSGCGLREVCLEDDLSKGNEGEADIVFYQIKKLLKCGLREDQIGVIVPYNLQVEILRQKLQKMHPGIEVKSVDGFQGREKEAILLSLVRSNTRGEIGFLSEKRRINVALTRARRHLVVVCDSETVGRDPFMNDFIEYATREGDVLSAHEVMAEMATNTELEIPKLNMEVMESPKNSKKIQNKTKTTPVNKTSDDKQKTKMPGKSPHNESETKMDDNRKSDQFDRRDHFLKILNEFIADGKKKEYCFPPSLTSIDRLFVHRLCEELGLVHISEGEKPDRFIKVMKNLSGRSENDKDDEDEEDDDDDDRPSYSNARFQLEEGDWELISEPHDSSLSESPEDRSQSNKSECYWSPFEIIDSDEVDSNDATPQQPAAKPSDEIPKQTKMPTKAAKNYVKPEQSTKDDDEDEFDKIIKEAMHENKHCAFTGCKKGITMLGQKCSFCKKTFCLSHHIAECHGCGDEAKMAARRLISREGKIYSGSGVPSKDLKPEKRAQLKSKLDKKLDKLVDKRKGLAPTKNKR